jgi:hypothetical protein
MKVNKRFGGIILTHIQDRRIIERAYFSEKLVNFQQTTRRYKSKGGIFVITAVRTLDPKITDITEMYGDIALLGSDNFCEFI